MTRIFRDGEGLARALASIMPRQAAKSVGAAAIPCVSMVPDEGGASSYGGPAILGSGTPWPSRPPQPDAATIAARAGFAYASKIERLLSQERPLHQLLRLDLSAMPEGAIGNLPREGTLGFFYDVDAGPWDTSSGCCRVVWTVDGVETLPPAEIDAAPPRALAAMASASPPHPSSFAFPRSLEKALMAQDGAMESYRAWIASHPGASLAKVMGSPSPRRSDPIGAAVAMDLYGETALDGLRWRKERSRLFEAIAGWRQVLQVDLAEALPGRRREGVVHFLIRVTDLAARDFSRVVAVHQS